MQLTFPEGLDYAGEIIDREITRKSLVRTNRWMIVLTIVLAIGTLSPPIMEFIQTYSPKSISPPKTISPPEYKESLETDQPIYHNHAGQPNKDSL